MIALIDENNSTTSPLHLLSISEMSVYLGRSARITELNAEKAKLLADIKALEEAEAVLDNITEKDIPDLASGLSSFANIWQAVTSACTEVLTYVERGEGAIVSNLLRGLNS
jgi:hypothetical protein